MFAGCSHPIDGWSRLHWHSPAASRPSQMLHLWSYPHVLAACVVQCRCARIPHTDGAISACTCQQGIVRAERDAHNPIRMSYQQIKWFVGLWCHISKYRYYRLPLSVSHHWNSRYLQLLCLYRTALWYLRVSPTNANLVCLARSCCAE